jgi:acyl-CoA synthetase (AMP-forming)/AMP-acid ligase II
VAIVLDKSLPAVESVFAITRAGAVGVSLDPRTPPLQLRKILEHCGSSVIITDDRHFSTVRDVAVRGSILIVVTENPLANVKGGEFQIVRYQDWANDGVEGYLASHLRIDDVGENEGVFMHSTSGTTGLPKAVLSSQKNWLSNIDNVVSGFALSSEDRLFWPLPLFHTFAHSLCIIATLALGSSVFLPGVDQTLAQSLSDTHAQESTIIIGAPATFHELVDSASSTNSIWTPPLDKLRACMYAGSSAPESLRTQVEKLFGVPLLSNYGCAETCGAMATDLLGDSSRQHGAMAPVSGLEMQILDLEGKEVDDGQQGELWVRGPGLMLGYYGAASSPFTADGWFPTGDLVVRSSSRLGTRLTVVGRTKELIIRGGENIQPSEPEAILRQHPDVADVVVAGVPHAVFGEIPAAFIVKAAEDLQLDLSALLAMCRRALPDYKVPNCQSLSAPAAPNLTVREIMLIIQHCVSIL